MLRTRFQKKFFFVCMKRAFMMFLEPLEHGTAILLPESVHNSAVLAEDVLDTPALMEGIDRYSHGRLRNISPDAAKPFVSERSDENAVKNHVLFHKRNHITGGLLHSVHHRCELPCEMARLPAGTDG